MKPVEGRLRGVRWPVPEGGSDGSVNGFSALDGVVRRRGSSPEARGGGGGGNFGLIPP